jgi:lipid-binding SYLF domain-containing protein
MRQMMISRRNFVVLGAGALGLSACDAGLLGNGVGSPGSAKIDARVDATRDYLFSAYPATQSVAQNAKGILYMPLVTELGLGIGGSFGRGALRINDVTVDYYSATSASIGLQIGAQQYAHAIFFMTDEALANFRRSNGWVAGAGVEYATPEQGGNIGKDTTEIDPVTVFIFGQQGLIVGATIEGVKYSRIIP